MLKRWLPASLIAGAMALALAGGAVLAVGAGHNSQQSDIFDRAAAILGIDPTDLQNAHDQASREVQDDQLNQFVDRLVANGTIEQTEADSFAAWMAERPDSADEALFNQLTSTIWGSPWVGGSKIEIHPLPHHHNQELNDRMAEILGIDPQELADALASGKTELESQDRLSKLHATIDMMLSDGAISPDEAGELHDWIDDTPQWLLDLDLSSRVLGSLGLFGHHFDGPGLLERLPFGKRHHFGDENREFRFEFRGPEGTFKFGPDEHDFPFDDDRFEGLLDRFGFEHFEELEEIDGESSFQDLIERFKNHGFFEHPFEELIPPTVEPESSTTSA